MNLTLTKELVKDSPIYIIGVGPSAKTFDMDSIQDQNVIAVNQAIYFFNKPHHYKQFKEDFDSVCNQTTIPITHLPII